MRRTALVFLIALIALGNLVQETPVLDGSGKRMTGIFKVTITAYSNPEGGDLIWAGTTDGSLPSLRVQDGYIHNINEIIPNYLRSETLWLEFNKDGAALLGERIRYSGVTSLRRETPGGGGILETMDDELQIGREGEDDELYVASARTGFGIDAPVERVEIDGVLGIREGTAPTATTAFGKVYVEETDGHLYYMDESGTATDLLETSSGAGGGTFLAAFEMDEIHLCVDQSYGLGVHLGASAPPYTHLWTGDTGPLSATDIPNPRFSSSTAGLFDLIYTITDGDGESSQYLFSVTVHANPTPSITATPSTGGCEGEPVLLSGDGCYEKYCWNPGGPCAKVFNVTESGTFEVTVMDQWGCIGTADYTVTFLDPPSANAGVNAAACAGGTNPTLGGTPTASGGLAPYSYNWTGSGLPYLSSGLSANPTFDVSAAAPGVYSLNVEVTDANGCSDTDGPVLVTVRELPTVSATATTPVCPGENIDLSGGATGGTAPYSYSWTGPDGFTSFIQSPTITSATVDNEGTYTLTVTDVFGCASSSDATVTLDSPPSIVTPPSDETLCQGLDASFSVVPGGTPPFTYQWQRNTGGGFADISGATSPNLTVTAVTPGMDGYQYRCVVTGHCSPSVTSTSATVNVLLAPSILSGPTDQSVDLGDPATFSVSASGEGTLSYQWQQSTDAGSSWSNVGTSSSSYTTASTTEPMDGYQYRCIVSGDCAPNDTSSSATLTVMTELFTFTSHTFTTCGQTSMFGPNLSQCRGSYSTTWDEIDDYFYVSTQGIQMWTVPADGTYRITARGAKGGGGRGGNGAQMRGDFTLSRGDTLYIVCGQQGGRSTQGDYCAGGGGGSYVYLDAFGTYPLIVAAGGGGQCEGYSGGAGQSGLTTSSGGGHGSGPGGTGGNGGSGGLDIGDLSTGGGGGGWLTDGSPGLTIRNPRGEGGECPRNGAVGGEYTHPSFDNADGGFGGGGSGSDNSGAGGGGGGYNGGGGGNNYSPWGAGGGGGSYNSGTNQSNSSGTITGEGSVTIELL